MTRIILIAIVLAALFGLANTRTGAVPDGPATATTLAELEAGAGRFEGQLVSVSGTVGERMSAFGWGGVRLADRRGHQVLVLGLAAPPAPGTRLAVTGTYRTAFSLGDISVPVILAAP